RAVPVEPATPATPPLPENIARPRSRASLAEPSPPLAGALPSVALPPDSLRASLAEPSPPLAGALPSVALPPDSLRASLAERRQGLDARAYLEQIVDPANERSDRVVAAMNMMVSRWIATGRPESGPKEKAFSRDFDMVKKKLGHSLDPRINDAWV